MSTIAQVVIGLLLLLAGLISVVAAVLGNPIRLLGRAIPGPNSRAARAVVASIGTGALAACAVVFILGGASGPPTAGSGFNPPMPSVKPSQGQVQTGSNAGSVGGLPAITASPTPTGSPKPPAAPSTAPPVPGKPTVTAIKVSIGGTTACKQTYRASVTVANGPVALTYVISVGGFVVGPNPRSTTVTAGTANLDDYVVDVEHAGEIAYNVLTPNLVSDQKSWTVPIACMPALNISTPTLFTGPGASQNCSDAPVVFRANLSITAPPSGTNVTYHVEVNGVRRSDHTEYFPLGSTLVGESVSVPDNPNGYSVTIRYVVTAPVADSSQATLHGDCQSPQPPPTTTDPPTTEATTADPDPTTDEPTTADTALVDETPLEWPFSRVA